MGSQNHKFNNFLSCYLTLQLVKTYLCENPHNFLTGQKRKSTTPENLWADDEFKGLKKQKLQAALEEQQVRIQLMKDQSILFRAQTHLANEQAELVRLQADEIRRNRSSGDEEILFNGFVSTDYVIPN